MSNISTQKTKQKILICGATGFIGRNMVLHFAKNNNYDVHAVNFNRSSFQDNNCNNITWHNVDLRDPSLIDDLLKDTDIIIQAAATTSGAKDITTKPYIHVTDNAVMNSYLFRSAYMNKVKHVIFFSCTVMYQSSDKPLLESDFDASQELHNKYFGVGHTKLYIEKMCEFYASINNSNTKFTAIRHSNIYGPFDKFDFERSHVFGATISKVMTAKDKITVWGSGEEQRDLLYIDDLVNFVELAINKQDKPYRLYNCGYGEAMSIKNLVNNIVTTVNNKFNKNLKIEHDLSQPTIKTSLCLDCSLAKQELGWAPKVKLANGIEKTLDWWDINIDPISLSYNPDIKLNQNSESAA